MLNVETLQAAHTGRVYLHLQPFFSVNSTRCSPKRQVKFLRKHPLVVQGLWRRAAAVDEGRNYTSTLLPYLSFLLY